MPYAARNRREKWLASRKPVAEAMAAIDLRRPSREASRVPEQWRYAFTNTFSEEESLRLYRRYHVPASGRILWSATLANYMPGPQEVAVDHRKDELAALL